jgi:hypothetical protein
MSRVFRRLALVLALVLLSSTTSFAAPTNKPSPSLKINGIHNFFPIFSKEIKNYAIYNCHKKKIPFSIINGSTVIDFNDYFENDQVLSYIGVKNGFNYDFTIRCLNDGWKTLDYKYKNYSKSSKGYILGKVAIPSRIICPEKVQCSKGANVLYIVDNNGVPMWYRSFQGNSNFTGFQLKGTKLEWFATMYKELPPQNNKEISGRVMAIDLKGNSILSNIIPYEIVNGEKVYPPIDFHDYKSTDKYFYFISYVDKIVNPKTIKNPQTSKLVNLDQLFSKTGTVNPDMVGKEEVPELLRKEEICKSSDKILIRETRVIRTDKKGLVNWSYEFNNLPTFGVSINIRDEKGNTKCEIDVQHPNWLSLDSNEGNLTVSLHNSGTYNIDIKNKEINWVLYNESYNYMRLAQVDSSKLLKTVNDPLKGVTRTHSGSFIKDSDLFLTFDNRMQDSEPSRAVIYKIDKLRKTATFVKGFTPPENKCSLVNSKILCMTKSMGNATKSPTGELIVNWGEKPGNKNAYTVYDKDYNVKLDVNYGNFVNFMYKHEYYDSSYFPKNFFSYDFLKSTNTKNNQLLYSKSGFICNKSC